MRPFNAIVTLDSTTGWVSTEVFAAGISGRVLSYTVRATTGTDNTNLDIYLVDMLSLSGSDDTPAANAAAEYRLVDDTSNNPSVSATEKFTGDVLAFPIPFDGGLRVYGNATGGTEGHYEISIRGWIG